MSKRVTLQIEDEILARALDIAGRSERELEDVLAEWLERYADDLPLEALSDEAIISLCDDDVNPMLKMEVRTLLLTEGSRELSIDENARLEDLLQRYRKMIVKRAKAIEISITRGLREREDYV